MGQQNSSTSKDISTKFQLIEKNNIFNTTILKEKNSQQFFIMKQITINNTEDFIRFKQKFEQKKKLHNQHHQSLIQFHSTTQSTFCSNLHKIIIIYQYVNHNLLQQIYARQKQNRPFQQKQIWSILCSITLAMSELQYINSQHCSIQPEYIYITHDGVIKIADPQLIPQSYNIRVDINKYYSPQILNLMQGKSVNINPYKSDVFCLGLCILHATLLQSCYDCYQYQQLYLKSHKLKQKIRKISNNYSQQLMTTIQLILQSQQRPDFLQLEQYLKKIMEDDLRDFNYQDIQHSKISQKRQRSILLLNQLQQKPFIKQQENQRDPIIQKLRQLDNQRRTNVAFTNQCSEYSNYTLHNNNNKTLSEDKIIINKQKQIQNNQMPQTKLIPNELNKINHCNNNQLPIIYKQEGFFKINKQKISNSSTFNNIENNKIDSQTKEIPKMNLNNINNLIISQNNTKPTLINANNFINNNHINNQSNIISNIRNTNNPNSNFKSNYSNMNINNSNSYNINSNSNSNSENNNKIKINTNNYFNTNNNLYNFNNNINKFNNNNSNKYNNKFYQNINDMNSINSYSNAINTSNKTPNINYEEQSNNNKFNKFQNKNYVLTDEIKQVQQKKKRDNDLINKQSNSSLGNKKLGINKMNSNEKMDTIKSNSNSGIQKIEKNILISNNPFNKINILNNNLKFSQNNEKNKFNQIKESTKYNQQKNIYYMAHLNNQSKSKLNMPLIHSMQNNQYNKKQIQQNKTFEQSLSSEPFYELPGQRYTNSNLIKLKQSDHHQLNKYHNYINNNLQMNNKPYVDEIIKNNTQLHKYNVLNYKQKQQSSQIKFDNSNNQHTLLSFKTGNSPMNDLSSININEISSYPFDQDYKNKTEKVNIQKMQRIKQNKIETENQKNPITITPISNNYNQKKQNKNNCHEKNLRWQKQNIVKSLVKNNDKNYMEGCKLVKQISFKSSKFAQKMIKDLPDCQFPQKGIQNQTTKNTHIPDQGNIKQSTQFQTQRNIKDNNQQQKDVTNIQKIQQKFQMKNSEKNFNTQSKKMPNYIIEEYRQGARYQGWKLNGLRQGHGKFYYQDGGLYSGMWKQNKMHGHGILYYSNGQPAYDGQWKNDKFHGIGALFNQSPEQLQQPFDYTDFDKIGNYWIRYEGEFVQDNKQGNGRLFLTNGQFFQGEFLNDDINGHGQYYLNSRQILDGYWQNNKFIS